MTTPWYAHLKDQLVGFVIETRKGRFKPAIARCIESEGDDDCFLNVIADQPAVDTPEQALAFLDAEPSLKEVFRQPSKADIMGFWLKPMVNKAITQ